MNNENQGNGKVNGGEPKLPSSGPESKPVVASAVPAGGGKKKGLRPGTILFLVVMVALLAILGFLGYRINELRQKKTTEAKAAEVSIPVHVAKVTTGDVEDIIYMTGSAEYADRVEVIAKIPTPGKLMEAHVKKGDQVEKGQVLATVHRDEVGVVYMPYKVKAPVSGMVATIIDSPGSLITAQRPVAVIINTDKIKIKTSVVDVDLKKIKEGLSARVRVDAFPDRVFEGTLTKIEPVLDSMSHTAPVEITVENSDRALIPGMFARIELVVDTHTGVPLVPKEAVFKKEGINYAFVVKKEEKKVKGKVTEIWRLHLTELKLGYYDQTKYEVVEGLADGDLVVDQDLAVLKDKTIVSIINLDELGLSPLSGGTVQPGGTAAPLPGATAVQPGSTAVQPGATVVPAATAPAAGSTAPAPQEGATTPSSGGTTPAPGATPVPGATTPAKGGTPLKTRSSRPSASDSVILLPGYQDKSILDEPEAPPPPEEKNESEPEAGSSPQPPPEENPFEEK